MLKTQGAGNREEPQTDEEREAQEALALLVDVANAAVAANRDLRPSTPFAHRSTISSPAPTFTSPSPARTSSTTYETPFPTPVPSPARSKLVEAVQALRSQTSSPVGGMRSARQSLCVPRNSFSLAGRRDSFAAGMTQPLFAVNAWEGKEGHSRTSSSDAEYCDGTGGEGELEEMYKSARTSPIPFFSSPPPPAFSSSPPNSFSSPTSTDDNDNEKAVLPFTHSETAAREKTKSQTTLGGLPPAQLTYAALDMALNLPGTEWIFQFLVIFVSWFGLLSGGSSATGGVRR